ncbi:hypothetical protein BX661DRAFT_150792, partial [Kickxella alabastrina]|uniref:uncharacterized protein n=1 Tax=Kickxella alabastrina TaxID=61397 RepID=UPI00221FE881
SPHRLYFLFLANGPFFLHSFFVIFFIYLSLGCRFICAQLLKTHVHFQPFKKSHNQTKYAKPPEQVVSRRRRTNSTQRNLQFPNSGSFWQLFSQSRSDILTDAKTTCVFSLLVVSDSHSNVRLSCEFCDAFKIKELPIPNCISRVYKHNLCFCCCRRC